MPTFIPALGQTSVVNTFPLGSQASSSSSIHLSFFITFSNDEDSTGSWEIWTDLPQTDDEGKVTSAPGEWRALVFELFDGEHQAPSAVQEKGSTRTIPLSPSAPLPVVLGNRHLTYRATTSIPAVPDQRFGYTFRHILESGETHWLGGEGSNGVVSVESMTEGESSSTSEMGPIDELQGGRWEGLAVEIETEDGYPRPKLTALPSTEALSPILTLLTTRYPDHTASFSSVSTTGGYSMPRSVCTASIGHNLTPFNLPTHSLLDISGNIARMTGRDPWRLLESTISEASAGFSLTMPISFCVKGGGNVVAFYYTFPEQEGGLDPTYHLIVYAAASSNTRTLQVGRPENAKSDASLVLIAADSTSHVLLTNSEDIADFTLLPGGTIAKAYKICHFSDLRGPGSDESVLICAPEARAIEIGEEEIDIPSLKRPETQSKEVSEEEAGVIAPVPTQSSPEASHTTIEPSFNNDVALDDDATITEFTEATPELEDSFDAASEASHVQERSGTAPATGSLWFFKLIERFLFGILDWLITASKPKIEAIENGEAGTTKNNREEEEADEPEAMTPADPHSPLLQPTQIRETTSETSSNPTSPLGLATLKPLPPNDNVITPISERPNPLETSRSDDAQTVIAGAVQIRSYTQFTFSKAPPFRFLLAPGAVGIGEKLRFNLGRKGGQWSKVEPHVSSSQSGCVELTIEGSVEGSGDWEVQVERA